MNCSSLRYNIQIKDYDYVQKFIAEIDNMPDKSIYWKCFVKQVLINNGIEVMFVENRDFGDFKVYTVFVGFWYTQMEYAGEISAKDIDELQRRYKNNPDFVFNLEWEMTREEVIMSFLNEQKAYDMEGAD